MLAAVANGEFTLPFVPARSDKSSFSKQELQTIRVVTFTGSVERTRNTRGQRVNRISVSLAVMKALGLKATGTTNPTSVYRLDEIDQLETLCEQLADYYTEAGGIFFPDFNPEKLIISDETQIDPVMDIEQMVSGVFASSVNLTIDVIKSV
jgi:hypothetical protein